MAGLTGIAEARRRIEEAGRVGATTVDLASLGLTSVPAELGRLESLRDLNLGGNQLTDLPPTIASLTGLRRLALGGNQLTDLPEAIRSLTGLRVLYLTDNHLSGLPKVLASLTGLQVLNLSGNQLTDLPEAIGSLTGLRMFYLSGNHLAGLPEAIGGLTGLQELDLGDNQLTDLPEVIGGLTRLEFLDLTGNQLTELPEALASLTGLRVLDLSGNKLADLPEAIADLTSLELLGLSHNRLTELPAAVADLRALEALDVRDNPLPQELVQVASRGVRELQAYLRRLREEGRPLREVKLVLVGEGDVGKTQLLRALQGLSFDETVRSTEGLEIVRTSVRVPGSDGGKELVLNAWDFGGQKVYQPTHQFFFTPDTVYLLVWDPRSGPVKCDVEGWLERIQTRVAERGRVLIVSTHADDPLHQPHIGQDALRQRFGELIHGFHAVDSRPKDDDSGHRTGLDALRSAIAEAAMPYVGRPFPASWQRVREAVREKARLEPFLALADFTDMCAREGLDGETALTLASMMAALGDVVYYADVSLDPDAFEGGDGVRECRNILVLQPEWLAKAIGFVLEDAKLHEEMTRSGEVPHSELRRIWYDGRKQEPRYDPALHPQFLWLMEQFNISYRLEPDKVRSLVPQLITEGRPDDLLWDRTVPVPGDERQLMIVCQVQGQDPPPALVPQMTVRSHRFRGNPGEPWDKNWQKGAFLNPGGVYGSALMELQDRELWFIVRARYPSHLLREWLARLDRLIRENWSGLRYDIMVPCQREDSVGRPCNGRIPLVNLREARAEGDALFRCPGRCNRKQPIDDLLYGINPTTEQVQRMMAELEEQTRAIRDDQEKLLSLQTSYLSAAVDGFRRLVAAQLSESRRAPSLFVLTPLGSGKAGTVDRHKLSLWCEWPNGPHPCACDEGAPPAEYEIETPKEWLVKAAPAIRWSLFVAKAAIPVAGAMAKAALGDLFTPRDQADVAMMEKIVGALPTGDMDTGDAPDRIDLRENRDVAALRAVHDPLERLAAKEGRKWGGLRPVQTKSGEFLWLCKEHAGQYDQGWPEL